MNRNKIVKFCEDYLQVKNFSDYCVNGLQIEGVPNVQKVVVGVSLSEKLIKEAVKRKAQMIIVHHGLFTKQIGSPPSIKGYVKERLKMILANNINLCGFHLPLDAHSMIGNNISLAKLLGLKKIRPLSTPDYGQIGYLGKIAGRKLFTSFVDDINRKLNTKSYTIAAGPKEIKTIGIISGGSSSGFNAALEAGADTFLCGEIKEAVVEAVREAKINFINAGHYNTEKLGVKNLGDLLAKRFNLSVEFIDVPCEI